MSTQKQQQRKIDNTIAQIKMVLVMKKVAKSFKDFRDVITDCCESFLFDGGMKK